MFLNNIIIPLKSSNLISNNNVKMIINPLPGTEIGIPLFFLEKTFTNLHYGIDINTKELFLFQCLIGFFTYGSDRLQDALPNNNNTALNSYLLDNKNIISILLFFSFIIIVNDLYSVEETKIFIIPLSSTLFYRQFKKKFGVLKPIYISVFWIISAIFIPCIWYDKNYNIIEDSLNYLPCFLSILGTSNLADIKDLEEDKLNNISTWPVKLGIKTTSKISSFLILSSTILFGCNNNINKFPLESFLFELQNIGNFIYSLNLTLNYTLISS